MAGGTAIEAGLNFRVAHLSRCATGWDCDLGPFTESSVMQFIREPRTSLEPPLSGAISGFNPTERCIRGLFMEHPGSFTRRPSLCTVDDTCYFYGFCYQAVNDDEGKRWHGHFPSSFHAP